MARIAGIDLPRNKRILIALTYIYGIGRSASSEILAKAGVDENANSDKLTDAEVARIRQVIDREYRVEGDLRKEVAMNIKRLIDIGSYRGLRHRKSLEAAGFAEPVGFEVLELIRADGTLPELDGGTHLAAGDVIVVSADLDSLGSLWTMHGLAPLHTMRPMETERFDHQLGVLQ